jgi:1,4-dihydroxy-6-naphthoate synthase
MAGDTRPLLTLGHSPDPDDAFMWWPLVAVDNGPPAIDTGRFQFRLVQDDIQSLNQRSMGGELDITAISCAQYPHVRDRYIITCCGASMGNGFGPKVVARRPMTIEQLRQEDIVVAVPGDRTTAFGALALMLGGRAAFRWRAIAFDEIAARVASGEFDAGLIIHEDQLTYGQKGLTLIVDVAAWWGGATGLPLPLGLNTLRRDLDQRHGPGSMLDVTSTLQRSILHALDHRAEGLRHAVRYARGQSLTDVDRFVALYVNQWTIDLGERGREAIERFLGRLHALGEWPDAGLIDIAQPTHASDVSPR